MENVVKAVCDICGAEEDVEDASDVRELVFEGWEVSYDDEGNSVPICPDCVHKLESVGE